MANGDAEESKIARNPEIGEAVPCEERGGIFIEGEMIKNVIGGENSVEKGEGSVPLKALFDLFHYLDRFPRYKYSKFPPQLRYTD